MRGVSKDIFKEILKAANSDDMPQETKDAIQMAFVRRFLKETDSGVTISYVQKKGEDASEAKIEGFSYRVEFGTCKLLADVCKNLGRGDKQAALRKVDDICEYAKKLINDVGGGIDDAQDCIEEAEG